MPVDGTARTDRPAARAVEIRGAGGVEVLAMTEVDVRPPGPGQVLVDVVACGLNRADILQRRGFYPAPPGAPEAIPGLEYAGTVAEVGDGVLAVAPGDRVMGIVGGGAMATSIVVHERESIPVPDGVDLIHAAAIPEVFLTAYDALFDQAGVATGTVALVHAVGSGVGTAAIQLLAAAGARSIGTSRTTDKLDRAAELGMDHGVLAADGAFAGRVRELTGGRGADAVLDAVGGSYLGENLAAVASRGTIVVIGLLGGIRGEVPLGVLLAKRARIVGTVLRSRPLEEKAALAQRFTARIVPLIASGAVRPVVCDVMPMSDIARAHERMENDDTFGKIVLTW